MKAKQHLVISETNMQTDERALEMMMMMHTLFVSIVLCCRRRLIDNEK